MSWVPLNLQQVCSPYSQLTTCQPSTMLFLNFLSNLLGYSIDNPATRTNVEFNSYGSDSSLRYSYRYSQDRGFLEQPQTKIPQPAPNFWLPSSSSSRSSNPLLEYYQNFGQLIQSQDPGQLSNVQPILPSGVTPLIVNRRQDSLNTYNDEEDEYDALPPGQAIFPQPDSEFPIQEYDFIVVGGGSAGCVVANRLSEIGHWKVLLLEAGIEEPLMGRVPGLIRAFGGSNIDWQFRTTIQKYACRSNPGGLCRFPRGKVMGGTSVLNYMTHSRGNKRDYDTWAALGNVGWSYNDVLPLFKKFEDNQEPELLAQNPYYHSTGGEQALGWFDYKDRNLNILLQAFEERGYPRVDPDAESQLGAVRLLSHAKSGAKSSSNDAFIRPIRNKRANLVIETEAMATRVIIDPATKIVRGVEYYSTRENRTKVALVQKEVILSAGVANSPKLLMLSGIGPAEELRQHGINVIYESAVGRNLQDHPLTFALIAVLTNQTSTSKTIEEMQRDVYQWLDTQTGPLSATGPLAASVLTQTQFETSPDQPDMQLFFAAGGVPDYFLDPIEAIRTGVLPLSYYNAITIIPDFTAARSRGYVKLNKTDPIWGPPRINPKYFHAYPDLEAMLAGIRIAQGLFETRAFQENGYRMLDVPLPACRQYEFDTDDYWRCVLIEYESAGESSTSTCKMGPNIDPEAVVDPRLRVYGVNGLRVADTSIMPFGVRGTLHTVTQMIGEKVSEMIKEDWL